MTPIITLLLVLVFSVLVTVDDWLSGHTLAELALRKEGVMVLGITREDGRFIGAPDGDTHLRTGDVLILCGRAQVMTELDQRQPGFLGNMAHQQNIAEQARLERREREKDIEPFDAVPS